MDHLPVRPGEQHPLLPRRGCDQLDLRAQILDDGRFHISSTTIAGERYLRLVVTAPDTSEDTIEQLLGTLRSVLPVGLSR